MIELVANDHNNVSLNMIIVDMNEDETESEKYSMKLIFSPFNLINVFTHLLDRTPSSLKNHRKIFHILAYPHLLKYISKLGILSDSEGFLSSDNLPFFIDIDLSIFE